MASGSVQAVKLHALKQVGRFDGTGDVERWIDRMELALRIDDVPESRHADVLALHLERDGYDTWKGMTENDRKDADKIKHQLRLVFGIGKFEAWMKVAACGIITPGETVDVIL